jgi:hypothetical protein
MTNVKKQMRETASECRYNHFHRQHEFAGM